jgi:transposase
MLIKTMLNRVYRFKSFVYRSVGWSADGQALEVEVVERANAWARCSRCQRLGPGYDRLAPRRFEFVPLWGFKVFLVYAPRRLRCPEHGVVVEHMPWALGKRPLTQAYGWFLAGWAKRLSWKEVAEVFQASWDSVFRSVEMAVQWGRAHLDLSAITSIGNWGNWGPGNWGQMKIEKRHNTHQN